MAAPTFATKSRDGGRIERPNGQRIEYLEILDATATDGTGGAAKHRIRVYVSSDSYAAQSFGRVERWDGNKWQTAAAISGAHLSVPAGLAYQATSDQDIRAKFAPDCTRLLKMAEDVLGF